MTRRFVAALLALVVIATLAVFADIWIASHVQGAMRQNLTRLGGVCLFFAIWWTLLNYLTGSRRLPTLFAGKEKSLSLERQTQRPSLPNEL